MHALFQSATDQILQGMPNTACRSDPVPIAGTTLEGCVDESVLFMTIVKAGDASIPKSAKSFRAVSAIPGMR